jgi:hypothetical protein
MTPDDVDDERVRAAPVPYGPLRLKVVYKPIKRPMSRIMAILNVPFAGGVNKKSAVGIVALLTKGYGNI